MVPSPANLCFLSGPLSRKNRIPRLTGTLPLTPMAFCADSLSSFSSSPLACSFPSNQISPISLFCDDLGLTPSLRRSLYFWNNVKGSRGKSQCLSPRGITSPRASCSTENQELKHTFRTSALNQPPGFICTHRPSVRHPCITALGPEAPHLRHCHPAPRLPQRPQEEEETHLSPTHRLSQSAIPV